MAMSAANFKIETGAQLLARLSRKPDLKDFYPMLFQRGPENGEVIEIYSDCSTSFFINEIICEALIQTKSKGIQAGVLYFKTDGNSNFDDLFNLIRKKISTKSSDDSAQQNEFEEMLANFNTMDVYDVTQFYATILNLENILMENMNISLIIFDSLTAFYWTEQGNKITRMDLYIKNLINLIQKVTKEYKTVCLYTRPEYFCTNKNTTILSEEINYQIHIIGNIKGNYQVNVKSTSFTATKFFKISNNEMQWYQDKNCEILHK